MRSDSGFTVLELFFALAVISVLLGMAVPVLENWLLDARLTTRVNGFVRAVHAGRHAAQTRLTDIVLCPTRNGSTCERTHDWQTGWLMTALDFGICLMRIFSPILILFIHRPNLGGLFT